GINGSGMLPGSANYFIGNDPTRWRTGIPTYAEVTYSDLYPGIDLTFSGTQGRLEYSLTLAPGADPAAFSMVFSGADDASIDGEGDLNLRVGHSRIEELKPEAWQSIGRSRQPVDTSFVLSKAGRVSL